MEKKMSVPKKSFFSEKEKITLVDLVQERLGILECKRTDGVFCKRKEEAWQELASYFNSCCEVKRTAKQLKTCYENIKKRARKSTAVDKVEIKKTGGGGFVSKVTPLESRVIGMIQCQFAPLKSSVDSDAQYHYGVEELVNDDDREVCDVELDESPESQIQECYEMWPDEDIQTAVPKTHSSSNTVASPVTLDVFVPNKSPQVSKKRKSDAAQDLFEEGNRDAFFQKRKLEMAEELHLKKLALIEKELYIKDIEIKIKEAELQLLQQQL
ncbi:myb/SANT-like DNA-binding domain-containing protein 3 [Bacillus rossius redtenbacheri]|uniref:myb/SANT-like DNA-binding domain-containing protein 3 n=1 Tax=Bacillus rossius redtenbacheri TaxID=93214 RepID=UPI002FDCB87D